MFTLQQSNVNSDIVCINNIHVLIILLIIIKLTGNHVFFSTSLSGVQRYSSIAFKGTFTVPT